MRSCKAVFAAVAKEAGLFGISRFLPCTSSILTSRARLAKLEEIVADRWFDDAFKVFRAACQHLVQYVGGESAMLRCGERCNMPDCRDAFARVEEKSISTNDWPETSLTTPGT